MNLTVHLLGHELEQTGNKITRKVKSFRGGCVEMTTSEVHCKRCDGTWSGMGSVIGWCKGAK